MFLVFFLTLSISRGFPETARHTEAVQRLTGWTWSTSAKPCPNQHVMSAVSSVKKKSLSLQRVLLYTDLGSADRTPLMAAAASSALCRNLNLGLSFSEGPVSETKIKFVFVFYTQTAGTIFLFNTTAPPCGAQTKQPSLCCLSSYLTGVQEGTLPAASQREAWSAHPG